MKKGVFFIQRELEQLAEKVLGDIKDLIINTEKIISIIDSEEKGS